MSEARLDSPIVNPPHPLTSRNGWTDTSNDLPKSQLPFYAVLVCLAILAALASEISLRESRHFFAGYDPSPMIDAGWRLLRGQVPGRDFIVTFPPSLYLATYLSFRYLGVRWSSLAVADVAIYAGLLVLGMRLCALLISKLGVLRPSALILGYSAAQTILLISINYPWHSSMAQSFALYAILATLVLTLAQRSSSWQFIEASVHLGIATSLLLLSKPNTSFLAVALCLGVLLWQRRWPAVTLILLASLCADSFILRSFGTSLPAVLVGYLGLAGRLVPRGFIPPVGDSRMGVATLLMYASLLPVGWRFAGLLWSSRRAPTTADALAAGAAIISLAGMGTNFDFKLTDAPLLLFGVALFACFHTDRTLIFRLSCTTLGLLFIAGYFGKSRIRMRTNDKLCYTTVLAEDKFLSPLNDCPDFVATLGAVHEELKQNPNARVFFGPSLEFLYADETITPPLHLPDWWDAGTSFPLSETNDIAKAWQADSFDILIFQNSQSMAYLPRQILDAIASGYTPVATDNHILLYEKNRSTNH